MSRAQDWRAKCPKCGAESGESCRTTSGTNRVTDIHLARIRAEMKLKREERVTGS